MLETANLSVVEHTEVAWGKKKFQRYSYIYIYIYIRKNIVLSGTTLIKVPISRVIVSRMAKGKIYISPTFV